MAAMDVMLAMVVLAKLCLVRQEYRCLMGLVASVDMRVWMIKGLRWQVEMPAEPWCLTVTQEEKCGCLLDLARGLRRPALAQVGACSDQKPVKRQATNRRTHTHVRRQASGPQEAAAGVFAL